MADKRYNILLAGESWVTTATHIKGFDQFRDRHVSSRRRAACRSAERIAFDLRYMPAHEAQRDFPQTPEGLAAYRRRHPVRHRLEHASAPSGHLDCEQAHAEPVAVAEDLCRARRRTPDGRGLLQLPGHQRWRALSRHAGRRRSRPSTSCLTTIASRFRKASRR